MIITHEKPFIFNLVINIFLQENNFSNKNYFRSNIRRLKASLGK